MSCRSRFELTDCSVSLTSAGLVIHRLTDGATLLVKDAGLLELLVALTTPRTIDELEARLPQLSSGTVGHLVQRLESLGFCQHPASMPGKPPRGFDTDPELMTAAYDASRSLPPGSARRDPTIEPIIAQIYRVTGILGTAATSLAQARVALSPQLRLPKPVKNEPLKVLIGGGTKGLKGWANVDVAAEADAWDVRHGLPFADASVRFVYTSFVFEHLFYPTEAHFVACEIARVLAPGGVARIVVPDAAAIMARYGAGSKTMLREKWSDKRWYTPLAATLSYLGAQFNAAASPLSHKFGYDFETLQLLLLGSGFSSVRKSQYKCASHPDLNVDAQSSALRGTMGETALALFVEAAR